MFRAKTKMSETFYFIYSKTINTYHSIDRVPLTTIVYGLYAGFILNKAKLFSYFY